MSASVEVFSKYPNPVFIETGACWGDGIEQAINAGFPRIISIELSPMLHSFCQRKFREFGHVEVVLGDSSRVLEDILSSITEPVTFWLDAHYSGGATMCGDETSPLMRELELIKAHPIKTHTILVDDLRDWAVDEHGFDTEVIKQKLLEINPDYKLVFEDGHIPNDILASFL